MRCYPESHIIGSKIYSSLDQTFVEHLKVQIKGQIKGPRMRPTKELWSVNEKVDLCASQSKFARVSSTERPHASKQVCAGLEHGTSAHLKVSPCEQGTSARLKAGLRKSGLCESFWKKAGGSSQISCGLHRSCADRLNREVRMSQPRILRALVLKASPGACLQTSKSVQVPTRV